MKEGLYKILTQFLCLWRLPESFQPYQPIMRSKAREDAQVEHQQEEGSIAPNILPGGGTGGGDSGFFDFTDEEGKTIKQEDQHVQAETTQYIRPRRTSKKLQSLNVRFPRLFYFSLCKLNGV